MRRGGREERGEKRERDGTHARTHTHTQPKAPRKRERDGGVEVAAAVGDGGVEGGWGEEERVVVVVEGG